MHKDMLVLNILSTVSYMLLGIAWAGVALLALLLWSRRRRCVMPNLDHLPLPKGSIGAKALLSAWEKAALPTLKASVPAGLHVCPQVRLGDLLVVTGRDAAAERTTRNRLGSKSVDFVVIDRQGQAIVVVELNDATHRRWDRRNRDRLVAEALGQAGIPLARFRPGDALDLTPWTGRA